MDFMDTYKYLEKLCSDMYDGAHGVSSYIEEMQSTPHGSATVPNWDYDLRQLKHCRWVRNQIAHDPGRTEENTCEEGDEEWLDGFYKRILKGKDPLALYEAAKKPAKSSKPRGISTPGGYTYRKTAGTGNNQSDWAKSAIITLVIFLILAIVIGGIILRFVS